MMLHFIVKKLRCKSTLKTRLRYDDRDVSEKLRPDRSVPDLESADFFFGRRWVLAPIGISNRLLSSVWAGVGLG